MQITVLRQILLKCPRGNLSIKGRLREYIKREQIGRKLEVCVSIDFYFLIVEEMIVLSVKENTVYQCSDWLGEFLLGKIKEKSK